MTSIVHLAVFKSAKTMHIVLLHDINHLSIIIIYKNYVIFFTMSICTTVHYHCHLYSIIISKKIKNTKADVMCSSFLLIIYDQKQYDNYIIHMLILNYLYIYTQKPYFNH